MTSLERDLFAVNHENLKPKNNATEMLRVPNSATSLRFPLVFVVPNFGAKKKKFLQKCCSNYEF